MTYAGTYPVFPLLPRVVDGPGRYLTRGGEEVSVDSLEGGLTGKLWARGQYRCGTAERWTRSGRLLPFTESPNDIIGRI